MKTVHVAIHLPEDTDDFLYEQYQRFKAHGYKGNLEDFIIGMIEEMLEIYANKDDTELFGVTIAQ